MSVSSAIDKRPQTDETPLERMAAMLHDDMKSVNELIIENMKSEVPLIPQLAGYLIAAGGKRVRPMLTLACTRLYEYNGPRPFGLAAAVEFIHTATLLHDDVVDESDQRRGKDAANLVFGNQATVLVGDFLFSRAFQLMVKDGSLDVLRILSDASATIAEGEVMQLATTRNIDTTMERYLDVIRSKTAALFAAACEIGPVIADKGNDEVAAMRDYGMNLGIAFQIIDDLLDYSPAREKLGKKIGDDFKEGKMTAPVMFAIGAADAEEMEFWTRTFVKKDQNDGDFAKAQEIVARHKGLEKGRELALSYAKLAQDALKGAPDNDMRACLNDLISFTVDRQY